MSTLRAPLVTGTATGALACVLAALLALLAGCGGEPATPAASASPSAPPAAASPPPDPAHGACYNLTYTQAVAQVASGTPVSCSARHTSETFAVGRLKNVVDGHLVAVDSTTVARQVASACPAQVARYLGGTSEDLRLSMLRPVGFTPAIEASDKGADWYRCDVIGVSGPKQLISLTGSLKGVLGNSHRAEAYRMCGATPAGSSELQRVPCSAHHTWRALTSINLGHGKYPGTKALNAAGTDDCRSAATKAAGLGDKGGTVKWSWMPPSAQEWAGGQTYGICWAPA